MPLASLWNYACHVLLLSIRRVLDQHMWHIMFRQEFRSTPDLHITYTLYRVCGLSRRSSYQDKTAAAASAVEPSSLHSCSQAGLQRGRTTVTFKSNINKIIRVTVLLQTLLLFPDPELGNLTSSPPTLSSQISSFRFYAKRPLAKSFHFDHTW